MHCRLHCLRLLYQCFGIEGKLLMNKTVFALLILMLLSSSANAACNAVVSRPWTGFKIEASTSGPNCAQAVATISLRKANGEAIWTHSYIAQQLLNFSQINSADSKAMAKALGDWISGEGFMKSVDALKMDGEFPFTPTEGIDGATVAQYRKAKRPLFCFIQGMESGNCLTKSKDGTLIELGIQSFPG